MKHLNELVSINADLYSNIDPIPAEMAEVGLVEVELVDENLISIHFRHVDDTQALISASIDRAGALALAEVLALTAGRHWVGE